MGQGQHVRTLRTHKTRWEGGGGGGKGVPVLALDLLLVVFVLPWWGHLTILLTTCTALPLTKTRHPRTNVGLHQHEDKDTRTIHLKVMFEVERP
jgi:hypothetical protein